MTSPANGATVLFADGTEHHYDDVVYTVGGVQIYVGDPARMRLIPYHRIYQVTWDGYNPDAAELEE